jgi:hypothetical protein
MCLVSVVVGAVGNQLPPLTQWPMQQVSEMQKVIKLLESIDKKLGVKDCYDPTKEGFLAELAKRVEALEQVK